MIAQRYIEIAEVPEKIGLPERDIYHLIIHGRIDCIAFQNLLLINYQKLKLMVDEWNLFEEQHGK